MKDERIESFGYFCFCLSLIVGVFIWLLCNTEKPLTPVEQYALEESDTKQYDGVSLRRVWHPELNAYRWEKEEQHVQA